MVECTIETMQQLMQHIFSGTLTDRAEEDIFFFKHSREINAGPGMRGTLSKGHGDRDEETSEPRTEVPRFRGPGR